MKRLFKPIALLIMMAGGFLFSCTESVDEPKTPIESTVLNPKIQQVINLANSEAERLFPPKSRSDVRVADVGGIKTICHQVSRGQDDTLVYVVNYEDNKGFALISGGKHQQPVLAVVPNGNYDPEIGTDNPGFNLFMDAVKYNALNDTTKKKDFELNPDYPMNYEGKYVKTETREITHYGPAIRVTFEHRWGQDDIYGQYCPNGLTGCVPLAIASIVSYLRYQYGLDSRFYYTYPGADIPYEDIEWLEIFRHFHSSCYYSDGTHLEHVCWAADKDAVHKSIGRICRQIGHDGKAVYYKDPVSFNRSTAVERTMAPGLLKKYLPEFGVSELTGFDSYATMRCIDEGLMYMRAELKSNETMWHAWFTDGYEFTRTEVKKYEADPPAPGLAYFWKLVDTYYIDKSLNYMRWGWHGEFDGWYSGKELDPRGVKDPFVKMQYVSVTTPDKL